MSGNPHLIADLESLIGREGPIRFDRFMERVLYHPEHGYYMKRGNPIGREGDFYTSSEVDPAMGGLIARLFGAMAERIDGFEVLELGAGTGRLARDILETQPFRYSILERSGAMRERQREALGGMDIRWLDALPSRFRGCIFSNEFFDALPVRRFRRRGDGIREISVGPGFEEVETSPSSDVDLPSLREGATADISFEATEWVRRIGRTLEAGYHLAIDYGYPEREFFARTGGTLMCYRDHRADSDPYSNIGEKDITAHVNFTELTRAAAESGLETDGLVFQRDFLVGLGLLDVMAPLAEAATAASIRRLEALKTLLLPSMMGDRFRVLLQRKGVERAGLPGFQSAF